MTDLDFSKYLANILLNSGEDCCSICANNDWKDICDNLKRVEETGEPLDNDVCYCGLKRYAEEHKNKHIS